MPRAGARCQVRTDEARCGVPAMGRYPRRWTPRRTNGHSTTGNTAGGTGYPAPPAIESISRTAPHEGAPVGVKVTLRRRWDVFGHHVRLTVPHRASGVVIPAATSVAREVTRKSVFGGVARSFDDHRAHRTGIRVEGGVSSARVLGRTAHGERQESVSVRADHDVRVHDAWRTSAALTPLLVVEGALRNHAAAEVVDDPLPVAVSSSAWRFPAVYVTSWTALKSFSRPCGVLALRYGGPNSDPI